MMVSPHGLEDIMIRHNKSDKFLAPLVKEINSSDFMKNLKNPRALNIYGVQANRAFDVVIPNGFPYCGILTKLFQNKGFKVNNGSYWELAETYNYKVLGLGHNIRKGNPEACKKVIMCCFMALNNMIKTGEIEPADQL